MISISTIEELQEIGNNPDYPLDGEYELTQDINAINTENWNNGAGFKPIGTDENPFTGKFDGKGYKIIDLYINRNNTSCVGLFSKIDSNGIVKNVGLESAMVFGVVFVGSLVSENFGTVTDCYSIMCTVSGTWGVGGLVGWNYHGTISNCYCTGIVYGNASDLHIENMTKIGCSCIGGLIGWNTKGTVTNSYSKCSVSGCDLIGGLIGENYEGSVINCNGSTLVSGRNSVGGLIGANYSGLVENCYSIASISGYKDVGELVGYNNDGKIICTNMKEIEEHKDK